MFVGNILRVTGNEFGTIITLGHVRYNIQRFRRKMAYILYFMATSGAVEINKFNNNYTMMSRVGRK